MKKALILVLLLLMLSGCACEHEWTEADCLNAQICVKCDVSGTAALGHDWTAADCLSAETCSRCGETRGEPLGHSYGGWEFTETEMTRSCITCQAGETADLDRGLYLQTLLRGCWEFSGLFHEEDYYSSYQFSTPGDQLFFGEDGTVTGTVNREPAGYTVEFREYTREENADLYFFGLMNEEGKTLGALFSRREDEDVLHLFYNETDQMLLRQHDDVSAVLAGTWGAEAASSMCSLHFNADRTVSGNIDGPFEGTWQLMDILQNEYIGKYCGLYICYERNGEQVIQKATIMPPYSYGREDLPEEFIPETITVNYNDSRLEFINMTQEEIDSKAKAMEEGPNMILGTWSSLFSRKPAYDSNPTVDESLLGYSITFAGDNTFTADMGRRISGTWEYRIDLSNADNEASGSHSYTLYIREDNTYHNLRLYYNRDAMPELILHGNSRRAGESRDLYLGKLSEEDINVISSVAGDWTSTQDSVYTYSDEESVRTSTMDYHFSFSDDGTFTGYDGTELQGTWNLVRIFYEGDSSRSYYFDLHDSASPDSHTLIIYASPEGTNVDFRTTTETYQRFIRLERFTAEQLEAAGLGPALPIGDWTSLSVVRRTPSGDSEVRVETTEYSISIREDGTFSAQLDTPLEGTWSFDHYEPDASYYYRFEFSGQNQSRFYYFYLNSQENFLTFTIETADKDHFYYMVP